MPFLNIVQRANNLFECKKQATQPMSNFSFLFISQKQALSWDSWFKRNTTITVLVLPHSIYTKQNKRENVL